MKCLFEKNSSEWSEYSKRTGNLDFLCILRCPMEWDKGMSGELDSKLVPVLAVEHETRTSSLHLFYHLRNEGVVQGLAHSGSSI